MNNNYSNPSNGYLTNEQINMIEESTTWYLGVFGRGINYKLAKYADTTSDTLTANTTIAKIGLLRVGELMAGQFDINENVFDYWAITPSNLGAQKCKLSAVGVATFYNPTSNTGQGIKPAMNLKENVIIKEGTGTKIDPFTIELFS